MVLGCAATRREANSIADMLLAADAPRLTRPDTLKPGLSREPASNARP